MAVTAPCRPGVAPPNVQRMFVGGDHGTIYQNRYLRRALGTLLGKVGYLEGVPEEVEVSLRERSLNRPLLFT